MLNHEPYMHRCLQLARLSQGYAAPNPMVGAVLVHNQQIIGEGWHQQYGGPHAEVACFESVPPHLKYLIPHSTLYVSLEPCNHYGKTPPCSLRIVQEGVQHVVIGCQDPFEKVNGTGIERLRQAGVQIETGILEKECLALNQPFFTYHIKKRPYITLKWAETVNGFMAGVEPAPLPISSAPARRWVHKLRSSRAAIMVGTCTALIDNPRLDNRLWWGKPPLRVVTDTRGQLPKDSHLLQQPEGLVVFSNEGPAAYPQGCTVLPVPVGQSAAIQYYMEQLHALQVQSVLVEGGAALHQAFLDAGLWDEVVVVKSTRMKVADGLRAPRFTPPAVHSRLRLGTDEIRTYLQG